MRCVSCGEPANDKFCAKCLEDIRKRVQRLMRETTEQEVHFE